MINTFANRLELKAKILSIICITTFFTCDVYAQSNGCINDVTYPVYTYCPPGVIVPYGGDTSATSAGTGLAIATDNCGIFQLLYSDIPMDYSPDPNDCQHYNYTILRTWSAIDFEHNTTTCNQSLFIKDLIPPTAKCKNASVTLVNGQASITAADIDDGSVDNASPVTLSASQTIFDCTEAGMDVPVILTVQDACGNTSTCTATVHVNGMTINLSTGNQTICSNSIATLAANPPASGTGSWTIAGPNTSTTQLSDATNPTAIFTPTLSGVYTLTWTIIISPCSSTSETVIITVNASPIATIAPSSVPYCNSITLTASPVSSSYEWKNNGNTVGTTQTLTLNLASDSGNYFLKVIDANNCTGNPASYFYHKQSELSSYIIYAVKKVDLYSYNTVNGSIGVKAINGQLLMQANSAVPSPAFVKAALMSIGTPNNVLIRYMAPDTVTLPTPTFATVNSSITDLNITANGTWGTTGGPYRNVTISPNLTSVTLDGNSFRTITIGKNSKVTFSSNSIDAYSISTSAGVEMLFNPLNPITEFRVARSVTLSTGNKVNPTGNVVTFVVGDHNAADLFRVDEGGLLIANVYAPELATITVGSSVTAPSTLYGTYIGYTVTSTGKNVTWNSYNCATPPTFSPRETPEPITSVIQPISGFDVRVAPNPSSSIFTFNIVSESTEAASIRIMEVSGRLILSRTVADPGMPIEIGQEMAAGNYFAEIVQGTNRKVLKITKME